MASDLKVPGSIPRYPNVNVWAGPGETYSTVRAAVVAEAADITGQGPFVIGVRKAYTDVQELNHPHFDGWVTTASDYIHLWVHPTVRHNGYWDDSKFLLKTINNQYNPTMYIGSHNIAIQGFQLQSERSGSTGNACGIDKFGSGSMYVSECIIKRVSSPNLEDDYYNITVNGIRIRDLIGQVATSFTFENNIIYNFCFGINVQGTPAIPTLQYIAQHNTIVDCVGSGSSLNPTNILLTTHQSASGVSELTTCIRNNLVYNSPTHMQKYPYNTVGSFKSYATGSGDPLPDTSYDTHNVGYDSNNPYAAHNAQNVHFPNLTPSFVDYASEDFRLSPGNNEHLRVGLNIRNHDFAPLSIDINGTSRDDGKPGTYAGAHHPQEKGVREFPVNEQTMRRAYRRRR